MLKKIPFLIILLLVQFGLFPQITLASHDAPSCNSMGIEQNPAIFLENSTDFTLKFTITNNNNFVNVLKDLTVRLVVDRTEAPFGIHNGGWFLPDASGVNIQDRVFTILLRGDPTQNGVHYGVLEWFPVGATNWEPFCRDVNYQVGAIRQGSAIRCTIPREFIPEKIPPNIPLTIKFIGKIDTKYNLYAKDNYIATTLTNNQGQGEFKSVTIPGRTGETKRVIVRSLATGTISCFLDTTIDATAPVPAPIPAGPVLPAPAVPVATPCTGAGCSTGGGESCEAGGAVRGPGIKTAIGCIHTNPAEFVKDFMKFIVAISGGLAFLMMLLGAFGMLTSAGNPDSLNAGRERLTSAVIGLLFVIFAVLLMQIIGVSILNIPGFK